MLHELYAPVRLEELEHFGHGDKALGVVREQYKASRQGLQELLQGTGYQAARVVGGVVPITGNAGYGGEMLGSAIIMQQLEPMKK